MLTISNNECHVFKLVFSELFAFEPLFYSLLTHSELEKTYSYKSEKAKIHFLYNRACLRYLLARYLNVEQKQINFVYDTYGKPSIVCDKSSLPIYFNVSHSEDLGLIAFTQVAEVGIDIEYMNSEHPKDFLALAQRFFHPNEYLDLKAISDTIKQRNYFYKLWTGKEAFVKAIGKGLSNSLDNFYIKIDENGRYILEPDVQLLSPHISTTIQSLSDMPNYSACLTCLGQINLLKRFDMREFLQ